MLRARAHYFPENRTQVSGRFLDYWTLHGALAQQGYPISEEMQEVSATDGKVYTDQYFERAVFESTRRMPRLRYALIAVGVFLYQQNTHPGALARHQSREVDAHLFPETDIRLAGCSLSTGIRMAGCISRVSPLSEEFMETSALNGQTYKGSISRGQCLSITGEHGLFNVLLSQLDIPYKAVYGNGGSQPQPIPHQAQVQPTATPVLHPFRARSQYQASASVDKPSPQRTLT